MWLRGQLPGENEAINAQETTSPPKLETTLSPSAHNAMDVFVR